MHEICVIDTLLHEDGLQITSDPLPLPPISQIPRMSLESSGNCPQTTHFLHNIIVK